jgi:hypothetical protein
VRRLLYLAIIVLLSCACFGRLSISASDQIDPRPILPGAVLHQEITLEGEGLLGAAARQSVSQKPGNAAASSGGWQVRDDSDGAVTRLRLSRSISLDAAGAAVQSDLSSDPARVQVTANDWFVVRRYRIQVDVAAPQDAVPPRPDDTLSQQAALAVLSAITYDHYLRMPGIVMSTNGSRADDGRLVWHVSFASPTTQQTLLAESMYPDVPRIVLVLALIASTAFIHAFVLDRRRYAVLFAAALAILLYTHNWSLFFLGAAGVAWLGVARRRPERRRTILTDGALAFGAVALAAVLLARRPR